MNARLAAILPAVLLAAACAGPQTATDAPATDAPAGVDMLGEMDEDTFKSLHALKPGEDLDLLGRAQEVAVPGHGAMQCYLSVPPGADAPLPGVLVIHEWWGLNDNVRLWTDRLAAEGYAALAVDLYDGVVASDSDAAMAAMQAVDASAASAKLAAAHDWLTREYATGGAPTGSIGWCFGGGWSMRSALDIEGLDAAVVYYGRTDVAEDKARAMDAAVLGIFGLRDRGITQAYVDGVEATLAAAEADFRIERYDADHAFGNPSSARYDHEAASAAWEEVRGFFAERLGGR
ncbi:MAG: dienelactone hydrolase family protein [Planctomycetota bacterium]